MTAVIQMKHKTRVVSYRPQGQGPPPRCPGYAEQTWLGNAQRVADSRPPRWHAAQTRSYSLQEGLGLQKSMGSYLQHLAASLHSAATPNDEQPADTSLQPGGNSVIITVQGCNNPSSQTAILYLTEVIKTSSNEYHIFDSFYLSMGCFFVLRQICIIQYFIQRISSFTPHERVSVLGMSYCQKSSF